LQTVPAQSRIACLYSGGGRVQDAYSTYRLLACVVARPSYQAMRYTKEIATTPFKRGKRDRFSVIPEYSATTSFFLKIKHPAIKVSHSIS
jgi:hypothetical protein